MSVQSINRVVPGHSSSYVHLQRAPGPSPIATLPSQALTGWPVSMATLATPSCSHTSSSLPLCLHLICIWKSSCLMSLSQQRVGLWVHSQHLHTQTHENTPTHTHLYTSHIHWFWHVSSFFIRRHYYFAEYGNIRLKHSHCLFCKHCRH